MAEHGGNLDEAAQAYGFEPGMMHDLSTGIAPMSYQMPLPASDAYQALPLASDMEALCKVARACYRVPDAASLCVGGGSQALLAALPYLFASCLVWCPEPTYNEHHYRWEKASHQVDGGLSCPQEAKIIILGQPNNPTGRLWQADEIARYLAHVKQCDGLLIIDEAFVDIMPEHSSCQIAGDEALVILRSVGKFYGLAGLRVGFAIGGANFIARLQDEIGPWPVSQPALLVAKTALADKDWQARHLAKLQEICDWQSDVLAKAGFEIITSMALFITIRHKRMAAFHHHLASHGYWTRIYQNDKQMMRLGLLAPDCDRQQFESLLSDW